jgi:hypothetical protein
LRSVSSRYWLTTSNNHPACFQAKKKATLRWLFLFAAAYCLAGSEAAAAGASVGAGAAGASVAAGAAGAAAGASTAAGAGAGASSFLPQAAKAAAAIKAAKTRVLFIFSTRVS